MHYPTLASSLQPPARYANAREYLEAIRLSVRDLTWGALPCSNAATPLTFAQDIRLVLIHLASRLHTLRFYATCKLTPPPALPRETLEVYAPLANRAGIWQLTWELEDLAFRFQDPATYKRIAKLLDQRRVDRESYVHGMVERLKRELAAARIDADVSGRPKHIYSIWRKMCSKKLEFSEVNDVRAFRIIVMDIEDCYTVLGIVHDIWQPVPCEFDDYISRPKPNGYRSLHTAVIGDDGQAFEVQIRTHDMHRFAECGKAAHWRYKEADASRYDSRFTAREKYDETIARLPQLLSCKDDTSILYRSAQSWDQWQQTPLDNHIYVLTSRVRVVALPQGATPVDFAYCMHSELGHRCRGACVDGKIVPLNTPLQNGQTVDIIAVKQGGPSHDWLNPQLGYLRSAQAKQKVQAWFNAIELQNTVSSCRIGVENTLQCEGLPDQYSSTMDRHTVGARLPPLNTNQLHHQHSNTATASYYPTSATSPSGHDTWSCRMEKTIEAPSSFHCRASARSTVFCQEASCTHRSAARSTWLHDRPHP